MSFSLISSSAMDAFVFVPLLQATRATCLTIADRYSSAGLDKAATAIRNEFSRKTRYDLRGVMLSAAAAAEAAGQHILREDTLVFLTEITPTAPDYPAIEEAKNGDTKSPSSASAHQGKVPASTPYLLPAAQRRMLPAWGLESFGLVCPAHWRAMTSRGISGWTLPDAQPQPNYGIPTIQYSDRAGLTFSFSGANDIMLARMDDPTNLSRSTITTWVGHMHESEALAAYTALAEIAMKVGFPVIR